jgi:hypothetical protein
MAVMGNGRIGEVRWECKPDIRWDRISVSCKDGSEVLEGN